MSKTSFKAFCVEYYANHTGKTGPEVYDEFERSGLLNELENDYEDLHGMGMESLMQLFDERLGNETRSELLKCEHHLIRATIIPEVARQIAERFGISEAEALDRFYKSATAQNLADEENGLYGQSALFIFGQFLEELETNAQTGSAENK